jgi:PAS domain S-box-containing protein
MYHKGLVIMPVLEVSSSLLDKIVALAEGQQQSVEEFLTSLVDESPSHSEAKYRHLVDKSLQGILIFQESRIVFANETAVTIYGYTPKELMALSSQGVFNLVHADDQSRVAAAIQRFWQGVQPESRFEIHNSRADGQIRIVEIFAS